jgi:hypothetical protein
VRWSFASGSAVEGAGDEKSMPRIPAAPVPASLPSAMIPGSLAPFCTSLLSSASPPSSGGGVPAVSMDVFAE